MLSGGNSMYSVDDVKQLLFPQYGDERGKLVVAEGEDIVPFDINRVFYIYGSDPNVVRGRHANRRTEFVLINVSGRSKVRVSDGRGGEKIFNLDRPHVGLYLPTMIWKDMYDFSADSVLLCLASEHYQADEYIRDYEAFCREVQSQSR